DEMIALLDVISTNVTSFYREAVHFDVLKDILVKWNKEGQKRYRVWCAAASSGEEPFTLAITLQENLPQSTDKKILATDISTIVLEKCKIGMYDAKKTEPIPSGLRSKYFTCHKKTNDNVYEVKPELRKMMLFNRLNLTVQPYPMKGPLDIIFCRNVMIYFNGETRQKIVNEMYRLLRPGGYLFVGHSESLTGMDTKYKIVKPSIYLKPE
ncbi:methyltransferase domain-containing protein, partial [bacterium]|nr:methyltransferase domain-containing protein [bacterium]